MQQFGDIGIAAFGHVYTVELQRPPYNFFDPALIDSLAAAFEFLDQLDDCRVLVLCAQGKAFCGGADFQAASGNALFRESESDGDTGGAGQLYQQALRLFRARKPVVAAIQGAAVGGGLGLALVADFRIGCDHSRFAANFVKLGVHAGFGITHVLPLIVGRQKASLMLYTGRRVGPADALSWGLLDELVEPSQLRERAISFAAEIAEAAPLAVESTRETLRLGLVAALERQLARELAEQLRLAKTADHSEGMKAVSERRPGQFSRR